MTSRRTAVNLLACLRDILTEHHKHQRDAGSGLVSTPLVLAVAVDEREHLVPLLRAAFESDDGLLVDATEYSDQVEIDGDVQELYNEVCDVISQLNLLPDAPGLAIALIDSRVTLSGSVDYASASQAQRALRGLLLSLFAVDLRASDLTALVYPEDALDAGHVAIVWPLLMRLPTLLGRPIDSTLVVVAGDSETDFDCHCTGDPSLRWRVTESGLATRHTERRDADTVDALARSDGNDAPLVVLMLGAGASAGYLPTGNGVRDVALERATGIPIDAHTYLDAAREFYSRLGRNNRLLPGEEDDLRGFADRLTLERVLREEQHEEQQSFSHTLRWFANEHAEVVAQLAADRVAGLLDDDPLVRLISVQKRLVLLTVNFDRVIEAKCGDMVKCFITEEHFSSLGPYLDEYAAGRATAVPLVKIHGDIDEPNTIVADVTTTRGGLGRPVYGALADLRDRLLAQPVRPLWYVGYSMRDLDLEDYWGDVRLAEEAAEHWVSPFVDPAVARFIDVKRIPRWASKTDPPTLDSSVVSLTASRFFSLLAERAARLW